MVVIIADLHFVAVPKELWDGSAADDAVKANRGALSHFQIGRDLLEHRLGVGLKDATLVFRAAILGHRVPGGKKHI